jgi:hypothetical protein
MDPKFLVKAASGGTYVTYAEQALSGDPVKTYPIQPWSNAEDYDGITLRLSRPTHSLGGGITPSKRRSRRAPLKRALRRQQPGSRAF